MTEAEPGPRGDSPDAAGTALAGVAGGTLPPEILPLVAAPPAAPLAMPKQVLEHPRGALLGGLIALFGGFITPRPQG